MNSLRIGSFSLVVVAVLAVAACDRGTPPRAADSTQPIGGTVQPAPATASASTPLPVSPSGSTNASTAAQGSDLSNTTRATGTTNVYQPGTASSSGQATSSETRGTSVPPNDGTLPGGTTGSTGSRSGGGKS